MTGDTELELLESELASESRRFTRGVGWIVFAVGLCTLCRLVGGVPLAVVVGVPASFTALVVGISSTIEGGVRSLLSAHEMRQLKRLPVARVVPIRDRCRST